MYSGRFCRGCPAVARCFFVKQSILTLPRPYGKIYYVMSLQKKCVWLHFDGMYVRRMMVLQCAAKTTINKSELKVAIDNK
jgi:hypothetical protein